MKHFHFKVLPEHTKRRLDQYLTSELNDMSRMAVQRLIEMRHVIVNGRTVKPGERLKTGDEIEVSIPPPQPSTIVPEAIELNIIHEDRDIIIIDKPAGLVIHPAAGHAAGTMVNALLHYDPTLATVGGQDRPGIVHRLDKGTSGIMVIARNEPARLSLLAQFKNRSVSKEYWALVHGILAPPMGRFESSLGRHPRHRKKIASTPRGKRALTEYRVTESYAGLFSTVSLRLHTGRTHQIRVHLAEAGHPILGDKTYGGRRDVKKSLPERVRIAIQELNRPALHAAVLGFKHPRTGEDIRFEAPLPEELKKIVRTLKEL